MLLTFVFCYLGVGLVFGSGIIGQALKSGRYVRKASMIALEVVALWPLYVAAVWLGHAERQYGFRPIRTFMAAPDDRGYWLIDTMGRSFPFGSAYQYPMSDGRVSRVVPVEEADIVVRPDTARIQAAAGVPNFAEPMPDLAAPIADVESTCSGNGYWLVGQDGTVYPRGDAKFYGSLGGHPQDYGIRWKPKPWNTKPLARAFAAREEPESAKSEVQRPSQ